MTEAGQSGETQKGDIDYFFRPSDRDGIERLMTMVLSSLNSWTVALTALGDRMNGDKTAIRRQQLEQMTREEIVAAWITATKSAELSTKKPRSRLIYEILTAEYPALPKPDE